MSFKFSGLWGHTTVRPCFLKVRIVLYSSLENLKKQPVAKHF